MAFSWDGRFVLRAVDEADPDVHRIYMHTDDPSFLTDALNIVERAPAKASRRLFEAIPVDPPTPWLVRIGGSKNVLMGVFQLKKM